MKGSLIVILAIVGGLLIGNLFPISHTSKAVTVSINDTLSYDQMHKMSLDINTDATTIDKNNKAIQALYILYVGKDSTTWKPVDQGKYEALSITAHNLQKSINDKIYQYNKAMNDERYKYTYDDVPLPAYYEYRN